MSHKKIRIAFDASPLLINKTGVGYYVDRMAASLAKNYADQVELVGFYYNFLGKRKVVGFPQAPNIRYRPVRFIPSKVVYQLRRWGIEVPVELFVKERVDFILFPNFLDYPSLRHTPTAPVIHDLTFVDLPQYVASKNGSDLRRFVPRAVNRSKFTIVVSEFTKDRMVDHYGIDPNKVVVTHVPPEPVRNYTEQECEATLKELGVTKPYIMFLGTVEPRKNIPALIDAYAALPKKLRDTYALVLVGRIGWNCDKEIARIKQAKADGLDVLHLGYVDERARATLYKKATIFSHASSYEGFGMPELEAMSYGIPCCVSGIPVHREICGDAALYYDQTNVAAITKALQQALEPTTRKRLSKASLARNNQYSWDKVAKTLFTAIKRAVS